MAVLTGLAPVAAAWLLRTILDVLVSGHGRGGLVLLAVLLGLAGGVMGLLPNVGQYLSAQSGRAAQRHATAEMFTAVARLGGLRRLEDPAFQDRLRVAEQAGSSGPGQVVSGGISIVQSALTVGGFLVTLAVLNPVMATVVVVAAIPAIYLERGIARRQVALISGISHGQRRQFFYANLLVSLAAAKEIRLFGLGGFFRGRMLDELREVQRASAQVDRRVLTANTALAGISALVTAGGLLWAVFAAAAGRLTVGDVSIFVAALGSVSTTLGMTISGAAMTYQALLLFRSYQDVLAEGPDLPARADPVPAQALRRGIEVDDVWFCYGPDEPWILRGVSCFIPHGQAVALVGHNGAGKSTLVKLLCRFYDPDRGRILWDGVDLRDMDLAGLRDRISAVFQDYMDYELSAAENITVGDLSLAGRSSSLIAAAQRAGIHDTLAALPRGYETLLTRTYFDLADKEDPQTGVLLSGGQWQRIALARAFLRGGRDLMILDEPSSGLDAEAEHEIHASLARNRRDCATVLISHRLNTIRDAEHIIVLSDGVISEQGDHDTLMAQSGIYARLFSLQARGYATEPATIGSGSD
ncbi:MAG TPA: ABC transporter ATP-binding protein [Streptosporangiaceae bacterium]